MADPYSILGVAKGASEKEVKSAYRKLAKELHPDRNKGNAQSSERFSDATKAYDLLSDKDKRAQYDRGEIDMDGNPTGPFGYGGGGGAGYRQGGFSRGSAGPGAGAGFTENVDFGDIFEGLFGGGAGRAGPQAGPGSFSRSAPPPKGANIAYKLSVEFLDAATLAPQRITLADGKTIDLKLPAGVETGTQMRLPGKGQAGPGGNGDAIVTITVKPHIFFRRDGDAVRLDLPITLKEAVEGAKVKVPTAEGAVMLTVRPGSNSGQQLRLKGRGFHAASGQRGDQIIELQIHVPGDDAALKAFVKDWQPAGNVRGELGV